MNASSRTMGIMGFLVVVTTVGGLLERGGGNDSLAAPGPMSRIDPAPRVPSGTLLRVRLNHANGSHVGDAWRGVLGGEVSLRGGGSLPAGGVVDGIVSAVHGATQAEAERVELRLISLSAEGRIVPLHAVSTHRVHATPAGAQAPNARSQPARTLDPMEGSEVLFRVR